MRKYWLLGLLSGCFHCQLILAQAPVRLNKERHHRVVLNNAYIRVLDGLVKLQDTTPMHVHAANSVVVFLSDSRFGIQVAGQQAVITTVKKGEMRYSAYGDKPVTHIVWDEGPEDFHFLVVELAKTGVGADSCVRLSQPGLDRQWHQGVVTAYYWDIGQGRSYVLPASDCAFLLIDLTHHNWLHFFPPGQGFTVKGKARYILLQLQGR